MEKPKVTNPEELLAFINDGVRHLENLGCKSILLICDAGVEAIVMQDPAWFDRELWPTLDRVVIGQWLETVRLVGDLSHGGPEYRLRQTVYAKSGLQAYFEAEWSKPISPPLRVV